MLQNLLNMTGLRFESRTEILVYVTIFFLPPTWVFCLLRCIFVFFSLGHVSPWLSSCAMHAAFVFLLHSTFLSTTNCASLQCTCVGGGTNKVRKYPARHFLFTPGLVPYLFCLLQVCALIFSMICQHACFI